MATSSIRNRLKLTSAPSTVASSNSLTPVKMRANMDQDYSPVFVPYTQESLDNVDVLWDWNSPHSNTKTTRRPKRLISAPQKSPRFPHKKSTNTLTPSFDKIRAELKAFQEEFNEPASPEMDFGLDKDELPLENANNNNKVHDLWDDSFEVDMNMVNQLEEKLKEGSKPTTPVQTKVKASPRTLTKSFSSNTLLDSPGHSKYDFKGKLQELKVNDSFDLALSAFDDREFMPTQPLQATSSINNSSHRQDTKSHWNSNNVNFNGNTYTAGPSTSIETNQMKFKAKSLSFGDHEKGKKTTEQLIREEIEKNRLAALAKRQAKKQQILTVVPSVPSDSEGSPIKCSPEEIELKRQQARAKLEMKKKHELMERNRREALKRLEMNRRKRQ